MIGLKAEPGWRARLGGSVELAVVEVVAADHREDVAARQPRRRAVRPGPPARGLVAETSVKPSLGLHRAQEERPRRPRRRPGRWTSLDLPGSSRPNGRAHATLSRETLALEARAEGRPWPVCSCFDHRGHHAGPAGPSPSRTGCVAASSATFFSPRLSISAASASGGSHLAERAPVALAPIQGVETVAHRALAAVLEVQVHGRLDREPARAAPGRCRAASRSAAAPPR